MSEGWDLLLDEASARVGEPAAALRAYSEFMPGPRVGWKPCGEPDASVRSPGDPLGFNVSEFEQQLEISPGIELIARHVVEQLDHLMRGRTCQISKRLLAGNPAWPTDSAARAGTAEAGLTVILSLALSRTQDDKGRVRWTLFGTSHDGPSRAFWRSFTGAGTNADGGAAFRRLLAWTLQVEEGALADLRRSGVRVLPMRTDHQFSRWSDESLAGFVGEAALGDGEALDGVRAVITFRPFAELPPALRRAYLAGAVRLIPTPASLIFFGENGYRTLAAELRHAMQIPLLHLFERCEQIYALRIPQSGWLHETPVRMPGSQVPAHHVRRTHRWEKHGRHVEDALAAGAVAEVRNDHVTVALFSTAPEVIGLYGKPMARNAQIWTEGFRLLLDGPRAGPRELAAAAVACRAEGRFGYRFFFPPMRVGERELFWHLPLVARLASDGKVEICPQALSGYLTAERGGAEPVELVPRRLNRTERRDAIELFQHEPAHRHATRRSVRKLLEGSELLGGTLAPSFARSLLTAGRKTALEEWLEELPRVASNPARGEALATLLRARLGPEPPIDPAAAIALSFTHARAFEEAYWHAICELSDGRFAFSNNADIVAPEAGGPDPRETTETRRQRQLEAVRNYLHASYERLFKRHGMSGRAVCVDQVFRWETDFEFSWWGGWRHNQEHGAAECNVVVVIPGRNRREAVVMGDHFDTAYMENRYDPARGGDHRRVAAAGADDNHCATAALLMAADVLLPLARDGKLERDVWLVHLTGEEFPADCLGSRALVQALIGHTLVTTLADGTGLDLSATRVVAAFILDMVAHNSDREHNVFQISPGDGAAAARLALLAHLANERWNAGVREWNVMPERRGQGRGRRLHPGEAVPPLAEHPAMTGQIRPEWDLHSTLYNTDAQIFSDAGVPVVLFMEDYDLNRHGYHDSEDTIANIDLDYGAALAAIAIETVAQAACTVSL